MKDPNTYNKAKEESKKTETPKESERARMAKLKNPETYNKAKEPTKEPKTEEERLRGLRDPRSYNKNKEGNSSEDMLTREVNNRHRIRRLLPAGTNSENSWTQVSPAEVMRVSGILQGQLGHTPTALEIEDYLNRNGIQ